ncbi:hypothetical protein [Yeosuana sp.]|uniref:hypothetical protein n=1 Tax=Yeosuana sp. TaxID=2529388 RepID=UPI004054D7BC
MNLLYIVPNINKVSGGPRTRITMFKQVFLKNDDIVIESGNKFLKSIKSRKIDLVYVESATNRISLTDFFCLLFLKLYAKKVTVFIRDIYIELFPKEYNTFRSKITLVLNRVSNFYLTLIASSMVFPTESMGAVFFNKNKRYPKRKYFSLPPGTVLKENDRLIPNFERKLGILYLGSTKYTNSGFDKFITLSENFSEYYNFYVLSGDQNLIEYLKKNPITLNTVKHNEISAYLEQHNIAYAVHTRPRNEYDDLTFPIKVLDFVSMQLPFFSEKHLPLVDLMGSEYKLFIELGDLENLYKTIQSINKEEYIEIVENLKTLTSKNTYDDRYKKLLNK